MNELFALCHLFPLMRNIDGHASTDIKKGMYIWIENTLYVGCHSLTMARQQKWAMSIFHINFVSDNVPLL